MPRLESIFLHSGNKGGYNIRSRLVGDDLYQKALFRAATILVLVPFCDLRYRTSLQSFAMPTATR
jgi:hypothetical protein